MVEKNLTTKDAIKKRRSIRKFKDKKISRKILLELINSAKLAPSGCNSQPWRFKIVDNSKTKQIISQMADNQKWIAKAPVLLACFADLKGYLNDSVIGIKNLERNKIITKETLEIINESGNNNIKDKEKSGLLIAFNVALAIENILLRALDFELGCCIIGVQEKQEIKKILGIKNNFHLVAFLAIGYPDEKPIRKNTKTIQQILL